MPPRHIAHFDTSHEGEASNKKTKSGVVLLFLLILGVGLRLGEPDGVSEIGIEFVFVRWISNI